MSLPPAYLSPEQREARLDELALPLGAEVETYGTSVEGRPLRAAFLRARQRSQAPTLMVVANIHGPEFVGGLVALGVLEALARDEPAWRDLWARSNLWIAPCLNPDGYHRTWQAQGEGTLSALRANANGVDLNRNFPLPRGGRRWPIPGSGSSRPGAATYRGSAPASEPETQALIAVARRLQPHAALGMHSFMGRLIPARTRDRADYARYGHLCEAFAREQPRWHYKRLANRIFDVYTGEQEDFLHHELGCWALCVETYTIAASYQAHLRAPSLFARFNPQDPAPWVRNDVAGIAGLFDVALNYERPGRSAPGVAHQTRTEP